MMTNGIDWDAYERVQQKTMRGGTFVEIERGEYALNSLLTGRERSSSGRRLASNVSGSGRKQVLKRLAHWAPFVEEPTTEPGPDERCEMESQTSLVVRGATSVGKTPAKVTLRLLEGDGYDEIARDMRVTSRQVRNIARSLGDQICGQPLVSEAVSDLRHSPNVLVAHLQAALKERFRKVA